MRLEKLAGTLIQFFLLFDDENDVINIIMLFPLLRM